MFQSYFNLTNKQKFSQVLNVFFLLIIFVRQPFLLANHLFPFQTEDITASKQNGASKQTGITDSCSGLKNVKLRMLRGVIKWNEILRRIRRRIRTLKVMEEGERGMFYNSSCVNCSWALVHNFETCASPPAASST